MIILLAKFFATHLKFHEITSFLKGYLLVLIFCLEMHLLHLFSEAGYGALNFTSARNSGWLVLAKIS